MIDIDHDTSAAMFQIADALAIGTLYVPIYHVETLTHGRRALSDLVAAETGRRNKLRFIQLQAKIGLDMIRDYKAERSRLEGG